MHVRPLAIASLLALLAACAGPSVTTGPGADPSTARGLLVAAATQGPVPVVVDAVPAGMTGGKAEVVRIAEDALSWLAADLVPVAEGAAERRRRLALRFTGGPRDAGAICAGTARPLGTPPVPAQLQAVFCDGPRAVADAFGTATGAAPTDTERLIRATLDRLFPGRSGYAGGGGFPGVSLGVGVGSGGDWGLGGGLHF